MNGRDRTPRRRIFVAVLISLSLHALVGLGWLHARSMPSPAGTGISTRVDGPDEDVVAFVLREPAPRKAAAAPKAIGPETPLTPPVTLPKDIEPIAPVWSGVGAVTQTAYSPGSDRSLEKSGAGAPLHGQQKPATTIAYVIDRSSSMGVDRLLVAATASVRASLAALGPDVRFAIVAYNGGTSRMASEPLPATRANLERAERWLAELTSDGRSDHRAGIREALSFHPDSIYLLTDADDLDANDTRAIRSLIRQRVTINAAIFGGRRTKWETPLERLVQESAGTVQYVRR